MVSYLGRQRTAADRIFFFYLLDYRWHTRHIVSIYKYLVCVLFARHIVFFFIFRHSKSQAKRIFFAPPNRKQNELGQFSTISPLQTAKKKKTKVGQFSTFFQGFLVERRRFIHELGQFSTISPVQTAKKNETGSVFNLISRPFGKTASFHSHPRFFPIQSLNCGTVISR